MDERGLVPPQTLAAALRRDEGQALSWLIRISLILIVVGLALFEIVGVVLAKATASDTADKVAQDAAFNYNNGQGLEAVQESAAHQAEQEGAKLVSLEINPDARTATAVVSKKAKTLFIQNFSFFRKYTTATAKQTANFPT